MKGQPVDEIKHRAEALSPDEQLSLAAWLIEQARGCRSDRPPRHRWAEIHAVAPCPLAGEDAQECVSRQRREADAKHESQWKPES